MSEKIWLGNDWLCKCSDLKVEETGVLYTNAAVVTMTLLDDDDDSEVSGQSWPAALVYSADGLFYGTLSNGLSLVAGKHYTLRIDFSEAGKPTGKRLRHLEAEEPSS